MAAIDGTPRLLGIVERELRLVNPTPGPNQVHEKVSRSFFQAVLQGNFDDTAAILQSPDVDHLTPDDYGTALQTAVKASHFAVVNLLLRSEKTKCAPPILGQCAIELVKHKEALQSVQQITRFARFDEVPAPEREKIIVSAVDADHPQIVDHLVRCPHFINKVEDKRRILNKMAGYPGYVREFLILFPFEPDDLINAAKAAVETQCLTSYLEILNSDQFKQKIYNKVDKFLSEVDETPLLDQIQRDFPLLQGRISKEAFGILFAVSAKAGRLLLPPEQFDQIPSCDLRRALLMAIRFQHTKSASEITLSAEFQKILAGSVKYLPALFKEICHTMPRCPSLVMILCMLLTAERLPHLSKEQLELFISTVSCCWYIEPADESTDLFPLFLKVFDKVTKASQWEKVSAQVIQDAFVAATRYPHVNREAMVQAFVNCGRFQEIRADTLFASLHMTFYDKPISSLEEILHLLCPLGTIRSGDGYKSHQIIRDARTVMRAIYSVVSQADSLISFFDFKQIFIKAPGSPHNEDLERVLIAAAGLGLQHIVHSILSTRLDEIRPFIFEKAVHYSLSGNQVIVFTCDRQDGAPGFVCPERRVPFDLERKAAITKEMLAKDIPLDLVKVMFMLADKKDFPLMAWVLNSDRFKKLPSNEQVKVRKASRGDSGGGCVIS